MSESDKKLSNPFSTGGGGVNFETRVQAAFCVLMMTGGVVPCLPTWPIKKIKLQGKHIGYDTDDLIVFIQHPTTNRKAKLLGQVKHSLSITKNDSTFAEVIQSAWNDFQNPDVFSAGQDVIALITGPLSATDIDGARHILEWARHSADANDFIDKVDKSNFSSKIKRDKLAAFRVHLKNSNGGIDVTDEKLWLFMKSFYLLGYDLDIKSGVTHSLLHSLIGQYSHDNSSFIWSKVLEEVQSANQNAGTLTTDSFSDELKKSFHEKIPHIFPNELIENEKELLATDLSQVEYDTEFVMSVLLGGWDDSSDADKDIIEKLTSGSYNDWIECVRNISFQSGSPIKQKNGKWKFLDRKSSWLLLSPRLFDEHLDRFKDIAVTVLTETDPKFELPLEERYAASIHGKVLKHSTQLRKGIAESLALLGSYPKKLKSCSNNTAEYTTVLSIREIFDGADAILWGSLNNLLPLLSEAAPEEFIKAIDVSLQRDPCPFDELFSVEGSGITSENYMTGLYWGLESLAWDSEYIIRAVMTLGNLAELDPGGNWGNRPSESLTTIFLPWLPQTTASVEKRHTAIKTLEKEYPDVAWKLLLSLLPSITSSSSGSHKPTYRNPDFKEKESITNKEYWEQISTYSDMVSVQAINSYSKLLELIEYFDNLIPASQDKILAHLTSDKVQKLDENDKFDLWSRLFKFIAKHKKYSDAEWSMSSEQIENISSVVDKLAPLDPIIRHQRIFNEQDFGLYEEVGDYKEQAEELEERRKSAIIEIFNAGGYEEILNFVKLVQLTERVGYIFGLATDGVNDNSILPNLIEAEDKKLKEFAAGYVWGRFTKDKWQWVMKLNITDWPQIKAGQFLAYLPFSRETWGRVTEILAGHEVLYWEKTNVNPYEDDEGLVLAIDKLLEYGRPNDALDCLEKLRYDKKQIDKNQIVRVLHGMLHTKRRNKTMDVYHVSEQIKLLQEDPDMDQDELFNIEWAYLPILERNHHGASPITLEHRLAEKPDFYCEAIQAIYRSKNEEAPIDEITDEKKSIASNAYRLLQNWSTPPGTNTTGDFDGEGFTKWLDRVKEICTVTGHLEVALSMMGHVLMHVPPDPDGLWLHDSVANEMNGNDAEDMRNGYRTAIYNSRGAHWVDPEAKEEIELAEKFRTQAVDVENRGYFRLATTLNGLAESYTREAENRFQGDE